MKGGNRIEGTWVNRGEKTSDEYVVLTPEGSEISVPRENVTRVVEATAEERRYLELIPRMPATADGNWRMAEWCRNRGLSRPRTRHLEAAIELDPNHAGARRALGYTRRDGEWVRAEDVRKARGYVQYKGDWYLPQELEMVKTREAQEAAEREWRIKLRRWHGWLGGKRDMEAREQFEMLNDPGATGELARLLRRERDPSIQQLLTRTLARFGGPAAEAALVEVALISTSATTRELARDLIVELGGRWAYSRLLAELGSKDINRLRRAGFTLGLLNNQEAVPPLIDVLVTVHEQTLVQGGPGSISTTFGNSPSGGGTGFSTGARTRTERKVVEHADILQALKNLTGENYGYDQARWRAWFAESNTPPRLNLRRGL